MGRQKNEREIHPGRRRLDSNTPINGFHALDNRDPLVEKAILSLIFSLVRLRRINKSVSLFFCYLCIAPMTSRTCSSTLFLHTHTHTLGKHAHAHVLYMYNQSHKKGEILPCFCFVIYYNRQPFFCSCWAMNIRTAVAANKHAHTHTLLLLLHQKVKPNQSHIERGREQEKHLFCCLVF